MNRNKIKQWGIFRTALDGTELTIWKDIPEDFVRQFTNDEPFLYATRMEAQRDADSCMQSSSGAFNYSAMKYHFRKETNDRTINE